VFSRTDTAKRLSLALAVGLGVGTTLLMGLGFAVLLVPLRHLAKAMEALTLMDFSALDSGRVLDEKSFIAEIRIVQKTFSTMVKAL
ncbi:hypothetical protein HKX48_006449, partial [Thoreauomyces humboldtii]